MQRKGLKGTLIVSTICKYMIINLSEKVVNVAVNCLTNTCTACKNSMEAVYMYDKEDELNLIPMFYNQNSFLSSQEMESL